MEFEAIEINFSYIYFPISYEPPSLFLIPLKHMHDIYLDTSSDEHLRIESKSSKKRYFDFSFVVTSRKFEKNVRSSLNYTLQDVVGTKTSSLSL